MFYFVCQNFRPYVKVLGNTKIVTTGLQYTFILDLDSCSLAEILLFFFFFSFQKIVNELHSRNLNFLQTNLWEFSF